MRYHVRFARRSTDRRKSAAIQPGGRRMVKISRDDKRFTRLKTPTLAERNIRERYDLQEFIWNSQQRLYAVHQERAARGTQNMNALAPCQNRRTAAGRAPVAGRSAPLAGLVGLVWW